MKNMCITFLCLTIIILTGIGIGLNSTDTETEYLRIHVRANSNSELDQSVKYKVRDAVVEYLTPFIAECDTREKAKTLLTDNLDGIMRVSDGVLDKNGFNYTSRASVKNERFPTRTYGQVTLLAGYYDALIVELGDGLGDNWWCVVYPPLCFTGEGVGYRYKSKIAELILNFYKNKEKINEEVS
jgi:stage II sporulation protein R